MHEMDLENISLIPGRKVVHLMFVLGKDRSKKLITFLKWCHSFSFASKLLYVTITWKSLTRSSIIISVTFDSIFEEKQLGKSTALCVTFF